MCPRAGIFFLREIWENMAYALTKINWGCCLTQRGTELGEQILLIITLLEMRVARRIWFTILRNGAY